MTFQLRLILIGASLCMTGCAEQTPPFPYPAAVVQASEQQHYKPALWCLYTIVLDNPVLRKPQSDSAQRTLENLVSLKQRLVKLERGVGTTCFHFEPVDQPGLSVTRVWDNCMRYGPPPSGFQPLVSVWVNQRDGLIDSVLNLNNIRYPGEIRVLEKGHWVIMDRHKSRLLEFHTDSPFKRTFLQTHKARLAPDLRQLCHEKGLL
jgi:hypothetical protein